MAVNRQTSGNKTRPSLWHLRASRHIISYKLENSTAITCKPGQKITANRPYKAGLHPPHRFRVQPRTTNACPTEFDRTPQAFGHKNRPSVWHLRASRHISSYTLGNSTAIACSPGHSSLDKLDNRGFAAPSQRGIRREGGNVGKGVAFVRQAVAGSSTCSR